MKIDKRNPAHWVALFVFGANVLVAWLLRRVLRQQPIVVLYGHKLSGNLLALYREAARHEREFRLVFLTMDSAYGSELRSAGVDICLATRPACAALLARAQSVVSDHGLHAMEFLLERSTLRFFDVWHGIPFKGFDAEDFRVQHRYDETWVASPLLRSLYIERFGFRPERVVTTGYARTDVLVRKDEDLDAIRQSLPVGVPAGRPVVLFAPTWKQGARQRSIWPFGLPEEEFLGRLSESATNAGATIVVRTHLNSGTNAPTGFPNIVHLPFAAYPDTEALLLLSDVLVCDWSSIAFDFLLLDRPTIFLEVDPPFRKGFSLGPEFRFGPVVQDIDALVQEIAASLALPERYWDVHGELQRRTREAVYSTFADGQAAARCLARLSSMLTGGSSR